MADQLIVAALPAAAGLTDLPVVRNLDAAAGQGYALALDYVDGCLSLLSVAGPERPLTVDFVGGRQGWRAAHERFRHEQVVKSCLSATEPGDPWRVVDATAGLGRDAFLLASAGACVTLIERQEVLAAMLRDGIRRLATSEPLVADRMTTVRDEAQVALAALPESPHCVLLDPMFPARQKSAAVKKELAFLQHFEAPPTPEQEAGLLSAARQVAQRRVVVKRPRKAPPLAGQQPSFQQTGKAIRFDVYLTG